MTRRRYALWLISWVLIALAAVIMATASFTAKAIAAAPTSAPFTISVSAATPSYAAGANSVFPTSVLRNDLPASPSVSPNSATWAAIEFQSGINSINNLDINQVTASSSDANDSQFPMYTINSGTTTTTISFTCIYSNICTDGHATVPVGAFAGKNSDKHLTVMDNTLGREGDFWDFVSTAVPAGGGSIGQIGSYGYCPYSGNGVGCDTSNATDIPLSISSIDPLYVQAAEASSTGSMPYAIGMGVMCADSSYVGPAASASDGANTQNTSNYPKCGGKSGIANVPPEGTRGYINKTDAQIDALGVANYMKAILRTMDKAHKGFIITDTIWGGASYGMNPYYIRAPYSSWQFAFTELGDGTISSQTNLPFNTTGLTLASDIVFCTNGTC